MKAMSEVKDDKVEAFLKADTKDFSATRTSISCRIYKLETEKLVSDRAEIEKLRDEREKIELKYQNIIKEAEQLGAEKKPLSWLSMLSKKKK